MRSTCRRCRRREPLRPCVPLRASCGPPGAARLKHGRYQPRGGFSTPPFAATHRAFVFASELQPMRLLDLLAAALAFLGRHGTRAVAASIFLGLAVPPLAVPFKPLVPEAIFLLLMLAFLRVDARELRAHFAKPGLVVLATAWIMLAVPAALGLVILAFGLPELVPDLFVGLMLQASAPPIMAAPALPALMAPEAASSCCSSSPSRSWAGSPSASLPSRCS